MLPKGSLLSPVRTHDQGVGAVAPDILFTGRRGWCGADEHSAISRAMKPMIGVRFAGLDKLIHLIEAWVKWCIAWGEASRIAATGPPRSEMASSMGTKPSRLRAMPYSPMFSG